jgi:hypothetical protein
MLDTAAQRPPTGLDDGARALVLRVLSEASGGDITPALVASAFFRDRFGGASDYLEAVEAVWGDERRFRLQQDISRASTDAQFSLEFPRRTTPEAAAAHAMLLRMPEPDFRTAVEAMIDAGRLEVAERITAICRNRGAPWAVSNDRFECVGDEEIERELIRPGLAAINRPEFSGGVKQEFEAARAELAKGAPGDLKQAIIEAGAAAESAMKVLLEAHRVAFNPRDTAKALFDSLEAAGIVPRHMENLVLVAMVPRNRMGGHGAGAVAHQVAAVEGEAVVAGVAGAIAYLATRLP